MKSLPIDSTRVGTMIVLDYEKDVDKDGKTKINPDGDICWVVEVRIKQDRKPGERLRKGEIELVKVWTDKEIKLNLSQPVEFTDFVGRAWQMENDGRYSSGVSLSASGVANVAPSAAPGKTAA